jgi:hypothetical protein
MATILIGWELGAGRGHLVRMADIARRLRGAGHQVVVASQRLARDVDLPQDVPVWQAPLWPRLLAAVGPLAGPLPNTMGDILVRMGLDRPETLTNLIGAWDAILQAVRPDAVVADYAPVLLTAARGRLPTIAAGLGFDLVPAHLDRFPSLTGQPPAYDEEALLDSVNRALAATGRAPLSGMPQLFAADRVLTGTFAELDPYAASRREPVVAPSVAHPVGEAGAGEEVFLYADPVLLRAGAFLEGLVRSALPVRVFSVGASATQQAELEKLGFRVERSPLPFAQIAARSRLTMSAGGLGFVSSSVAAGVPTVVVHFDLEKALSGQAVTRLQLGGHVHLMQIKPDAFATSLRQLYGNDSFQRRARELAPGFRARLAPTQEELAAAAVDELLT